MERDLVARMIAESGLLLHSLIGQGSEDGYLNSRVAGVSFPTLLNVDLERAPFLGGVDYGIGASHLGFPSIPTSGPVAFSYCAEDFTVFQQKQMIECSINGDQSLKSICFNPEKAKLLKPEPVEEERRIDTSMNRFEFRSQNSNQPLMLCNSAFRQLPDLRSLEVSNRGKRQVPSSFHVQEDFAFGEPSQKSIGSSLSNDSSTLDAILRNLSSPNPCSSAPLHSPRAPPSQVVPQSMLARQRRKKISDKTRCLQKLMPWDKKMDMATMLQEAYKYIKFLKAQVSVLQSMPCQSSFASQAPVNVGAFAGLEKLNRQQLLQVLMNSPVAQTILYSKGCCVISLEQLLLLKQITGNKILLQQTLMGR